jgi:hypothetical protein
VSDHSEITEESVTGWNVTWTEEYWWENFSEGPVGRPRRGWEDGIEIRVRESDFEEYICIPLLTMLNYYALSQSGKYINYSDLLFHTVLTQNFSDLSNSSSKFVQISSRKDEHTDCGLC